MYSLYLEKCKENNYSSVNEWTYRKIFKRDFKLRFHLPHSMYVWNETIASRGSQELASCCLKHLENVTTQSHVIAYIDTCTGQNRNLQIALMWLKVVQSENNIEIIYHEFLLSGHSYLLNDADYGIIEMALGKMNFVYAPHDYYNIIA
ncbi:uncharacterized protein [Battus philenor]|uniref:uncharacterized protein n=1 Tax=Battus philenor TaxID=42288 RepID=UPI0035CEDA5B